MFFRRKRISLLAERDIRFRRKGKPRTSFFDELSGSVAVIDVFAGKRNKQIVSFTDVNGTERKMYFSQGSELQAGSKHAIYRHLNGKNGYVTIDDIEKIHSIMSLGRREENGNRISYTLESKDGVKYTVAAEKKKGAENFVTYYTNRKASSSGMQNMQQSAQADNENALIDAKLCNVSETAKESWEKVEGDGVSSSGVDGMRERAENEVNQAVFCSSIVVA